MLPHCRIVAYLDRASMPSNFRTSKPFGAFSKLVGASKSSPPNAEDSKAAKPRGDSGDLRSSVVQTRMAEYLKPTSTKNDGADLPQRLFEDPPSFPVRDWLQTHAKLQCHLRASKVKTMKVMIVWARERSKAENE